MMLIFKGDKELCRAGMMFSLLPARASCLYNIKNKSNKNIRYAKKREHFNFGPDSIISFLFRRKENCNDWFCFTLLEGNHSVRTFNVVILDSDPKLMPQNGIRFSSDATQKWPTASEITKKEVKTPGTFSKSSTPESRFELTVNSSARIPYSSAMKDVLYSIAAALATNAERPLSRCVCFSTRRLV